MKTYSAKASDINREWLLIDAAGKTPGVVAVEAATILMGKNKPTFTRHMDTGDFVIVVNAGKVRVTGKKLEDKMYYRHSLYPGGLTSVSLGKLIETRPQRVIEEAVSGMLPHNRLGRAMIKKLKVYPGPEHPHAAQQPKEHQLA